MHDPTSFGSWLKHRRRILDLTQKELARRAYCSVGTIRKIEADTRRPSRQLATLLAESLEIQNEQIEAFVSLARTEPYVDGARPLLDLRAPSPEFPLPEMPKPAVPHNLPPQPTPFVGFERELTLLEETLLDPAKRLLTIVGPGGIGKTRLALALAERQLDAKERASAANYPDGVFFVPLTELWRPEHIVPALADALNYPLRDDDELGRSPKQQMADYLRKKRLLLVMDNFEHLLEAADLVIGTLQQAPAVSIVVTSRERLRTRLEHVYLLGGLAFPGKEEPVSSTLDYPAAHLFLQSARRNHLGFTVHAEDDLEHLAQICRLVEGMPLALELAAAWVDTLSLDEIAAELSRGLSFLKTEMRDVEDRHCSMRAAFDASWQRLNENEQATFAQLSVFRGGFTRQAGMSVTGASLGLLSRLAKKSMLQVNEESGRYQIHELLRQYGAEKMAGSPAEEEAALDRHGAYYCRFVANRTDDQKGSRQPEAVVEMSTDIDNVRPAWRWAVEQGNVARLEQALEGLCIFYDFRSRHEEGEGTCRLSVDKLESKLRIAPHSDSATQLLKILVRSLTWQARFQSSLGNRALSQETTQRSLNLLSDRRLAGNDTRAEKAAILSASVGGTGENYGLREKRLAEESLCLYRQLGNRWETAQALYNLSHHLSADDARKAVEESLAIYETLGHETGIAYALEKLSAILGVQGQLRESDRLARRALAVFGKTGNKRGLSVGLRGLASSCVWQGRFDEAQAVVDEYIEVLEERGFSSGLCFAHAIGGYPAQYLGRYRQAEVQALKGLSLCRQVGEERGMGLAISILARVALAMGRIREAGQRFRESLNINRTLDATDNVAQVLAILGYVARAAGRLNDAKGNVLKAMGMAFDYKGYLPVVHALPAIALLFADEGQIERAVELYALALTQGIVANSKWFDDIAGRHIAEVAATLPPDVAEAARARGQSLELWQAAEALVEELATLGWRDPEQNWPASDAR